jgi:hypothetical protein
MKSSIDDSAHAVNVQTSHDTSRNFLELLGYIFANAKSHISAAARDLSLSDASLIRLRRALDRVVCANFLLETVLNCRHGRRRGRNIASGERGRARPENNRRGDALAVELLLGSGRRTIRSGLRSG